MVVQSHSLCWEFLIKISGSVAALLGWWSGGATDVKQSENLTNFCLSETWTSRRKLWSFCHPAKLLISWICISVAHHCEGFFGPKIWPVPLFVDVSSCIRFSILRRHAEFFCYPPGSWHAPYKLLPQKPSEMSRYIYIYMYIYTYIYIYV